MAKNGVSKVFGGTDYGFSPKANEWYPAVELPHPPVFMEEARKEVVGNVYPDLVENIVMSPQDITDAINNSLDDVIEIKYGADINVPLREDGKITTFFVPEGKTLIVDLGGHTHTCFAFAYYVLGGKLIVKGAGTIRTTDKSTRAAIHNQGGEVVFGGNAVIDTRLENNEKHDNYMYGIANSKGGITTVCNHAVIHTQDAAGISTNNTLGQGHFYVKDNAVLKADNCSAIYQASMDVIDITDNAVVDGGIIARMGHITIEKNAKVFINGYDEDYYKLGRFVTESGCEALPDAITLMIGMYKKNEDAENNDAVVVVKDNAVVSSKDGSAIGICDVGSKFDQVAKVTTEKAVTWKVYEHDELATLAKAEGKNLAPKTKKTDITLTIAGNTVYPVAEEKANSEEEVQG